MNKVIRTWLMADLPGHFDGKSSQECLNRALAAFKIATGRQVSADEFARVLDSVGLRPDQIRNGPPPLYRLALPAQPVGVSSFSNAGALKRIQGER